MTAIFSCRGQHYDETAPHRRGVVGDGWGGRLCNTTHAPPSHNHTNPKPHSETRTKKTRPVSDSLFDNKSRNLL